MSIEAMAICLHHSRATGSAKIILLGIANHDGDGGAWPAVATLAKYANIAPRNVFPALDKLERLGEIRRIHGQGGDHSTAEHLRPNLYRILLECPHDCDRSKNHRTRRARSMIMPLELVPDPMTPASPQDHVTNASGDDERDSGPHDAHVTQTTPLTQELEDPAQPQYTRPRSKSDASGDAHQPATASLGTCSNGHPNIGESGGGVPFCAHSCSPREERKTA